MGIDHAKPAQREQRRASAPLRARAPGRPCRPAPAGRSALRAARRPAPRRQGSRPVPADGRRAIAGRIRASISSAKAAAIALTHRIGVGVDRLGDHRPGELAVAQRARAEGGDRGRQRRERPRRGIGRPPHRLRSRVRRRSRPARRPVRSCRGNSGRRCRPRRPARAATGAIWIAAMPPAVAASRAASTMASWRALSRRITFSVRR